MILGKYQKIHTNHDIYQQDRAQILWGACQLHIQEPHSSPKPSVLTEQLQNCNARMTQQNWLKRKRVKRLKVAKSVIPMH